MVGDKNKTTTTTKLGKNRGIPKTQLGFSLDQKFATLSPEKSQSY
jgi:hypothetical protein